MPSGLNHSQLPQSQEKRHSVADHDRRDRDRHAEPTSRFGERLRGRTRSERERGLRSAMSERDGEEDREDDRYSD